MACTCTSCPACQGTGDVWYSFGGEYLGNRRCDDLDELEPCDECGGSGVDEYCDECLMAEEEERTEEWLRESKHCPACGH